MNYKKIYDSLIEKAKNRILEGYVEKHHIIPRCIGGTDDKENIVILTPEEHFLAHQLLVKIYPNESKLIFAAAMMICHNSENRNTNKLYGWLRRRKNLILSEYKRKDWVNNYEKRLAKLKEANQREDVKYKKSIATKKMWEELSVEEKKKRINKWSEAGYKAASIVNKEKWKDPVFKEKMKKRKRGSNSSSMKEKWKDPEFKEKMKKASKKNETN